METIQDTGTSMESVENVTTEAAGVETEGNIEVGMGGSFTSFDDLEGLAAHAKQETKEAAAKEVEKDKIKEEIVDEKSKGDEKQDSETEIKAEGSTKEEDVKAKGEETPDGTEQGKEEATTKETTEKVRSFKTTLNGEEVDLKGDTAFKAKVDGEEQDVSLQDALNSWSGHKAVDKRFSELNVEKQNYLEQKRQVDDNINEIFSLADAGKPQEALVKFFTNLGVDPHQAMGTIREQVLQEAEKLAGMSTEERTAYEAELKTEQLSKQVESYKTQEQTRASQAELQTSIAKLQTEHEVDNETFDKIAEELMALKTEGKITQQVTPELVVQVAVNDRNIGKATKVLETINPDVAVEENINAIVRMMQSGMSDADIQAFASGKWGTTNPATALAKKIQKSSAITEEHESNQKPVDPNNSDIWEFEQISY